MSAHVYKCINVLLVLYNSAELHGVEQIKRASNSFNGPCFVCIESAVLNKSFDMTGSVSHLLKTGTCCHLLVVLLSNLFIHGGIFLPQKHIHQNIV